MLRIPEKNIGLAAPEYRQQEYFTPESQLAARVDDSFARLADAGDGEKWRAIGRFAEATGGAAKVILDVYTDFQRTKAYEALTLFQIRINEALHGDNGIMNLKGEAALDSERQLGKAALAARNDILRQIKMDEQAQAYFAKEAEKYVLQELPGAQRHAAREFRNYQNETFRARLEVAKSNALMHWNDPEAFREQLTAAGVALLDLGRINGWSAETTKLRSESLISEVHLAAGQAALENNNIDEAQRFLHSGLLQETDALALKSLITAKKETLAAQAEANRNNQARRLLSGEKEALYRAQHMGDVSGLQKIATGLNDLGFTAEADQVRATAEFWTVQRNAGRFAATTDLPQVAARLRKLAAQMHGGLAGMDTEERKRLSGELEAISAVYQQRVAAYQADPAQAAAAEAVFPAEATLEDIVALRMERQAANGVPADGRKPLTKHEAASLAQKWAALPVEQRPAFLHKVAQYGNHMPLALKQAGISVLDQDIALAMLGSPENMAGARAVFSIMGIPEANLPSVNVAAALEAEE